MNPTVGLLQRTLWDATADPVRPRRKRRHTADTSSDAYRDGAARHAAQERRVLDALRRYGPMTREQVARRLSIRLSSVCGRMNALVKAGEVRILVRDGRRVRHGKAYVMEAVIPATRG